MTPIKLVARAAAWACAALLAPAAATAATFTFQQGVAGYSGGADTMLRATDPDTAHGADTELSIDASDGGLPTQSLLRFDRVFGSAAGQIGSASAIAGATLTLQITSAGSGLRLFDMLVPWSEATLTWNGAGNGIQANGIEAAAAPWLEIGANNGGSNIEAGTLVLDVTDALRRIQSGSAPGLGWALLPFAPDGTNGVDFYSHEWVTVGERPLLTVQTLAVPEPSAAALALAGGLGLAGWLRGRRR